MGLLVTEESYRASYNRHFEEFLDSVIESGELELMLPDVVLFGDDFTLEDRFKVSRELKSINDLDNIGLQPLYYKDKATYNSLSGNQVVREDNDYNSINVNNTDGYSIEDIESIKTLEDAKEKIKIISEKINKFTKERAKVDKSKKTLFQTIINYLKKAIFYITEKIREGYYSVKDDLSDALIGEDKVKRAQEKYNREIAKANRLAKHSPILRKGEFNQ